MSFAILERTMTALVTEAETFVVNIAATKVDIVAGTIFDLGNDPAYSVFNVNSGFLLESLYLRLPYQFTLADGPVYITLNGAYVATGIEFQFPEIGAGSIALPIENTEVPVNQFIAAPVNGTGSWRLRARIYLPLVPVLVPPAVSMLNTPAALDGLTLPVIVGAVVRPTQPLVAG